MATQLETLRAALVARYGSGGGGLPVMPEIGELVDLIVTSIQAGELGPGTVGTAELADGAVTAAKFAQGAAVAAALAAGLGASANVAHGDASPVTVLAAHATKDRACIVMAICTESLAGGGGEPTFDWGWDVDPDGLLDQLVVASATVGDVLLGAGVLPATKALICTIVDGAADGGPAVSGAFATVVIALPTT
jgi:hypothetical protein